LTGNTQGDSDFITAPVRPNSDQPLKFCLICIAVYNESRFQLVPSEFRGLTGCWDDKTDFTIQGHQLLYKVEGLNFENTKLDASNFRLEGLMSVLVQNSVLTKWVIERRTPPDRNSGYHLAWPGTRAYLHVCLGFDIR